MLSEKPADEQAPARNSARRRATARGRVINPSIRWLALADSALRHVPTEQDVAEMEALARKEQAVIKRRIRRTAEKVKRQSKSKPCFPANTSKSGRKAKRQSRNQPPSPNRNKSIRNRNEHD